MSGQLKIAFRDGSTRVIKLGPEFFTKSPVWNNKMHKMDEITPREKAVSIAESLGYPYNIELCQGEINHVLFEKTYENNRPAVVRLYGIAKKKPHELKQLKKKFKGYVFTSVWDSLKGMRMLVETVENEA